jgi:DMSO/TMAO reductase YedYZ molybdopterin-dependent catalytic subunit
VDGSGLYGPGQTLTYAAQKLLTRHSLAREFSPSQISHPPFANGKAPKQDDFQKLQAEGFAGWRLEVGGMVDRPRSFSLPELRALPARSQITHLACEEGWSFIAQWTGVPLSHVLQLAGIQDRARFVVYDSLEKGWGDAVDMADALHPQTLLTYSMNGADLPVGHGGPLRMRVPRQLGYKSVKFIARLTVTDRFKLPPGNDYAWYAGI